MKLRIFFLVIMLVNLSICKEKESIVEDVEPFYMDAASGCSSKENRNIGKSHSDCVTKRDELNCYRMLLDVQFSKMNQIFKNSKWTSPDFNEHTYNYYFDQKGNVTILAGGPSETQEEYEHIGKGGIYEENKTLLYEHHCDQEKCEKLNFPIEYINCAVRYFEHGEEYRLFLIIGNKYYNHYDFPEKRKFLSIVLEDPVEPQIENGFELYLVPPPVK
ncbi:hypothetical protein ACO2KH_11005 [Leptospira terpstrae]|uniref:hypothetical protein n=1 Tax=Leptospira terpstrae TaxID=293075 RepID=UPI003CFD6F99